MRRREFVPALAAPALVSRLGAAQKVQRKGRLKQCVTGGVFGRKGMKFEDQCREAARLGIVGYDLVGSERFAVLKQYGLIPTLVPGGSGIHDGVNHKENHSVIFPKMKQAILDTAAVGGPNVIVLSGSRRGMSDAEGMDHTVAFFNSIKSIAEDNNVTLCMELLNSKVNHPDYMCDHTGWGVEVCKRVNSPRVKLLYDIYHMQIMEGDIIRTIRQNIEYIAHFHTAGNPGRHEFDDTQEMNYRGIARAIVETGYQGYLAHEYGPLKDPIQSLDEAITICDV
ncbi:MAG: TIM barrel protein [Bryobacterales bacterium]|nr:TIM barrel protein [Bryobacterales bacterium]